MKCPECNKERKYVQRLMFNEGCILVCPICALKIINEMHSLPEGTSFTGTLAQEMYEEELEYAKHNTP